MVHDILKIESASAILTKKSRPLSPAEIKSDEIQDLIKDMQATMRNAPGVGLAAPQIGVNVQLAVIEDDEKYLASLAPEIIKDRGRKPVPFHVIINPEIIATDGDTKYFFEACLSVNNARVTPRYDKIKVKCLDEHANEKIISAEGWYARILQHEIDHLLGVLYIERAIPGTEISMNEYRDEWAKKFETDVKTHAGLSDPRLLK